MAVSLARHGLILRIERGLRDGKIEVLEIVTHGTNPSASVSVK
jgi:hypothetical protein